MKPQEEFITKLVALAEMCSFKLSPDVIELYDKNLRDVGYEKLNSTLNEIVVSRKAQDRFPSIRDIRDICEPGAHTVESATQELLQRTMEAVSRFGYYDPEGAKAYMGEDAWAALPGARGWEEYCTAGGDGAIPIHVARSQLRDRIKSRVSAQNPTGRVSLPPAANVPLKVFVPHPEERQPVITVGLSSIGEIGTRLLEEKKDV